MPSGRLNSHLREELAVQLKTAMLNHVEVTLFARLVRCVRVTRGWSRGMATRFVVLAYKPEDPSHDPATHGAFRAEFPVALTSAEVKAHFGDAVRSLHGIAVAYESMRWAGDLPRAAKVFSIAPVRTSFVPAHIPLTNTVLLELLPPILGVKPKALKDAHSGDKRAFLGRTLQPPSPRNIAARVRSDARAAIDRRVLGFGLPDGTESWRGV